MVAVGKNRLVVPNLLGLEHCTSSRVWWRVALSRPQRWRAAGFRTIVTMGRIAIFAATMVGPFLLMVSASLQPNMIYLTFPMKLVGPGMGFENYASVFSRSLIGRWIFNSAVITVSGA